MSNRITALVLLIIAIIGCDDTKNPLEGTKWLLDDNGTPEYVHFGSNMFDDYYYDSEFTCYDHLQLPYSVSGNKLTVLGMEFTFEKTANTLTLINHVEVDTAMFVACNFDPDTLDICGPVKRLGKSFFNK